MTRASRTRPRPPPPTEGTDEPRAFSSLPARDLPSYYDPPSSPSAPSDSDGEGPTDAPTSFIPTTNRGHKLSRLAPHTRRGRLGHHANVDAGFIDDTTSSSLVPPAQKRRKLNDLAAASSTSGFAVAPNLHLVPRSVHALSREPDRPYPAHLPPVPQSPLDLLLTPAVQHTLGRKNNTFHLLSASATSLIEQEAELVGALTKVCRGLRGEGFDWRWEGDDERRRERDETRRKAQDEEERRVEEEKHKEDVKEQVALDQDAAAATATAQPAAEGQDATPAPAAAPAADRMDVEASPAATATSGGPALEDAVKLEQATPVLSAPTAPGAVSDPVAVPGVSTPAATPTPAPVDGGEQAAAASSAAGAQGAAAEDVEMKDGAEATAGASDAAASTGATPAVEGTPSAAAAASEAEVGASASAPGSATATPTVDAAAATAPNGAPPTPDVPAIAVTAAGSEDAPAVRATPAEAAPTLATANGTAAAGVGEAEQPAAAAGPSTDATPVPGPDEDSAANPALAATAAAATADAADAPSAEATPAPSLSEEPSVRRRSGRVARGAAGAPGRHTRSRQSSPEEGYTDAEDDGGDPAGEGSSVDEPLAGRARAQPPLVEEEEMPEYAARLVDPEVFVRGLFVSEGEVEMERVVPGPGGGMVGTGQMETCVHSDSPRWRWCDTSAPLTDLATFPWCAG